MKNLAFLIPLTMLFFCSCRASDVDSKAGETVSSVSTFTPTSTPISDSADVLDVLAVQKLNAYRPEVGSAVAFSTDDGAWCAAYPIDQISSYEAAKSAYPDRVLPQSIGEFSFQCYFPYSDGYTGGKDYGYSFISYADTNGKEGIIDLPVSCGQTMYSAHYKSPQGYVLILSVDTGASPADAPYLVSSTNADGSTVYEKANQPYTLGTVTADGAAVWLSSTSFDPAGTVYTENNPEKLLSQDELKPLLMEAAAQLS